MTLAWRVRLLLLLQFVFWVAMGFCFYYYVSTANAISRQAAEVRLGRSLPPEWDRVFIDHGIPKNWPYDDGFKTRVGLGFLFSFAIVIALEILLYRMTPKGGWMCRILTWNRSREGT